FTRTSVPRPPGARSKRTEPSFRMSAPGSERHRISSFGRCSIISASHSYRWPAGPSAFQCEWPPAVTVTDSSDFMKRGKLSKFSQNWYTSSGERFTTMLFVVVVSRFELVGLWRPPRPRQTFTAPSAPTAVSPSIGTAHRFLVAIQRFLLRRRFHTAALLRSVWPGRCQQEHLLLSGPV